MRHTTTSASHSLRTTKATHSTPGSYKDNQTQQHNYDTKSLPNTEPLAASWPTPKTSEEHQLHLPWIIQRRLYMAPEERIRDLESPSTMLPTE